MAGIPPTGIQGRAGSSLGLGVANFRTSVDFYDIIFKVVGGKKGSSAAGTWWDDLLIIRSGQPPTTNATIYISVPSQMEIAQVVSALKADPRFSSRPFVQKRSPPLPKKPRKFWVEFPDPDGNIVTVTFTSPELHQQ